MRLNGVQKIYYSAGLDRQENGKYAFCEADVQDISNIYESKTFETTCCPAEKERTDTRPLCAPPVPPPVPPPNARQLQLAEEFIQALPNWPLRLSYPSSRVEGLAQPQP